MSGERTLADIVVERLRNAQTNDGHLKRRDFDFSQGTPSTRSVIAEWQAERAYGIRDSKPFDLSIMAVETKTTDGNAGDTETFNLSHDLLSSNVVGESLVLYEGNQLVQPDSVDYAANSFDYTDDGTNNDLAVFYAAGDQALVSIQKVAPNGTPEELFAGDISQIHRRDQNERPLTMDLDRSPFQPIVPTDFRLEVAVNAPYTASYVADPDGDGTDVTAANSLLDIPVTGAASSIPDLGTVVRNDMASR
jgi:hypothetical protein